MAQCKICGAYIQPEEGVTVDPDTCDDCWGYYSSPDIEFFSDADSGL